MQKRFRQRRKNLRTRIKSLGTSSMLITNINNVKYLTGFTGSAAYLFVTPKTEILMSDGRYAEQLESECPEIDVDIRDTKSTLLDSVQRVANTAKFESIAFEADSLTKSSFDALESILAAQSLVSTSGIVESLRVIKDSTEISIIRRSINVNQRAFEVIRSQLTPDQTELHVAHNLEHQMRAFGATCCAFDPIVGIGTRAALPHGKPSAMQIREAPFVLIDWGAKLEGYMSDLTRVIVTSKISDRFAKVYNTVLKAQLAAIKKIRPGVKLTTVDRAARKIIEDAGFGDKFGHGLGHSFGLEIHEKPFMSPSAQGTLKAGMMLTVEPGIYIPDFGGVRIEDDILVTTDGCEVLSNLPKQLDECTVDLST